jgi:hypothetical protein
MMGNLYFRVADLGIDTQLFADEEEAIAWLLRVSNVKNS